MQKTTNLKGQIALTKVELRALELGYVPSKPIFDTRYDLILDDKKSLKRVQVKYANGIMTNSDGSIRVKLEYKNRHNRIYVYNDNEIDGLIVYIPKIDRLCLLPPNVYIGRRYLCVRIKPSKNNQKKGVLFADDYLW